MIALHRHSSRRPARWMFVAVWLATGTAFSGPPKTAAPRPAQLAPGSIGVARLLPKKSPDGRLRLELVFPDSAVTGKRGRSNEQLSLPGPLVLFDAGGKLARVEAPPPLKTVQWCENDGGEHFRPQGELLVDPKDLARPLTPQKGLEGIVAFVALEGSPPPTPLTRTRGAKMSGDLDGDGKPEAILRLVSNEAGCGNALDLPNSIWLYFGATQAELLCCGP